MCGCVCACLSLPVVCCWAIWQLPSTPNCRIMQQTCVNLASTNKNCAQLSIFGVNLSQFASTNKNTPFSHFGANLSQLQAQTLGTPNLSNLKQSFVSICMSAIVISKCRSWRTNLSYRTVICGVWNHSFCFARVFFGCCCIRSELGVALEVLEREGFGSGSGFEFCLLILIINYLLQLL